MARQAHAQHIRVTVNGRMTLENPMFVEGGTICGLILKASVGQADVLKMSVFTHHEGTVAELYRVICGHRTDEVIRFLPRQWVEYPATEPNKYPELRITFSFEIDNEKVDVELVKVTYDLAENLW